MDKGSYILCIFFDKNVYELESSITLINPQSAKFGNIAL